MGRGAQIAGGRPRPFSHSTTSAVVHFVGGEAKPWHLLVLRYQGREEEIPVAVRRLQSAWEQLYWLAKTPKVCAGLSDAERAEMRRLLDAV